MAQRGGARPGAGRPKGARNKWTREAAATIAELAQQHSEAALGVLLHIATKGESEAARVSAANAILDRGHGKPTAPMEIKHMMSIEEARAVVESLLPQFAPE